MPVRNVLFAMADQLRWDHLGCAGHPHLRTPNLDRLAQRGTRFTQAYVQSGICGPSRMSFYTGRYVSSHGATHNRVPLSVGEVTLGWHLRDAGRTLALAGKSHVVPDAAGLARLRPGGPSGPDAGEGSDELAVLLREGWFSLVDRHDGHHAEPDSAYAQWLRAQGYDSPDPWTDFVIAGETPSGEIVSGWKMRNARLPARVREEHSETAYTTDQALRFIEAQGDTPWVLHLSYVKPHWPYLAPAPWHEAYGPKQCLPVCRHARERQDPHPVLRAWYDEEVARNFQRDATIQAVRPTYQGLVAQLDHHLGRIWQAFDRLGRWEDTLVVFTSDHGDYLGDHWLGEKELFHDCIQRVPLLVFDPAGSGGQVVDAPVEAIDVAPSILDALGLDQPTHWFEGSSLLPWTRGPAPETWRDQVVSELDWSFRGARRRLGYGPGRHHAWMVRTPDWKYVHWSDGLPPMLFDLRRDPNEFVDLGREPGLEPIRDALRHRLLDWFTGLKRRTTLSDADVERRTDAHKAAGVHYGEW